MILLESVDKVLRTLPVLNRVVDKLVSKLLPAVPVAAGCSGGWTYYIDSGYYKVCEYWQQGAWRCKRYFTRTYYYPVAAPCSEGMSNWTSQYCAQGGSC